MPRGYRRDTRFDEIEPVEEPGELRPATWVEHAVLAVADLLDEHVRPVVRGRLRQGEVTARRQRVDEAPDHTVGIVLIGDEMHERAEYQRNGLSQVKRVAQLGRTEDRVEVPDIR